MNDVSRKKKLICYVSYSYLEVSISPHVFESADDVDCIGAADDHTGMSAVPVTSI